MFKIFCLVLVFFFTSQNILSQDISAEMIQFLDHIHVLIHRRGAGYLTGRVAMREEKLHPGGFRRPAPG